MASGGRGGWRGGAAGVRQYSHGPVLPPAKDYPDLERLPDPPALPLSQADRRLVQKQMQLRLSMRSLPTFVLAAPATVPSSSATTRKRKRIALIYDDGAGMGASGAAGDVTLGQIILRECVPYELTEQGAAVIKKARREAAKVTAAGGSVNMGALLERLEREERENYKAGGKKKKKKDGEGGEGEGEDDEDGEDEDDEDDDDPEKDDDEGDDEYTKNYNSDDGDEYGDGDGDYGGGGGGDYDGGGGGDD